MRRNQVAGYIFEMEILELLKESDFVDVKEENLKGRGTEHQIDAYGTFAIPIPFTYPIRLIAEAKCYKESIELPLIRSFFGVITDISENYIVGEDRKRNTPDRYLDTGCFFAANSFTKDAQDFAWAHNIFLISFSGNEKMSLMIQNIRDFTKSLTDEELKELSKMKGIQIKEIRERYKRWRPSPPKGNLSQIEKYPSLLIGIIDSTYPVIVVGNRGWYKDFKISGKTDKIKGVKTDRKSLNEGTFFNVEIEDDNEVGKKKVVSICFTLPDTIAGKIKERIGKTESGRKIFDLDIPLIVWDRDEYTRRIIKIEVNLPEYEKKKYEEKIKGDHEQKKEPFKILNRLTIEDIRGK